MIPKSEVGKWRLILDLSSPEGFSEDRIMRELCSLSHMSMDNVARGVRDLGKGTLMVKFVLKAAYRNVPVHDGYWVWCRRTISSAAIWT